MTILERMTADVPDPGPLTRIEFLILAVLARGSSHGYGIAQELQGRLGERERIRPGSLYRVIDRLMDRGLVKTMPDGSVTDRRTDYELTEVGRNIALREARLLGSFTDDLRETLGDAKV